jgi:hypothetical protein
MEIIRKIVKLDRLRAMIDIPPGFKHSKVEILILPIENRSGKRTAEFDPDSFFGTSNIENIDMAIQEMREEWDRR